MKRLLTAACLTALINLAQPLHAQVIWNEDFSDAGLVGKGAYGDTGVGTNILNMSGVTNWGIDVSAANMTDDGDWFYVTNQLFQSRDTGGAAVWTSQVVDISGYAQVSFSVDASGYGGNDAPDYFDVSYAVDGGAFVLLTNWNNLGTGSHSITGDFALATIAVYGIAGNSLGIKIALADTAAAEFHEFDNVQVTTNTPPSGLPPVLDAIGNKSVSDGNPLQFDVSAADLVDSDNVTLWASNLPTGATFPSNTLTEAITGTFNWASATPAGVYTTTFYAVDTDGEDSETITITVLEPVSTTVVINEFYNGTPDAVELLVISNNLDMRGMVIKDYSSDGAADGGGKYSFAVDALWESVRAGTLIVLRKDNSAADASAGGADYNLDVGLDNSTYFTSLAGSFNIGTEDIVQIKTAGSDSNGTTGAIHTFGTDGAGAYFDSSPNPKLKCAFGDTGTGEAAASSNSTASLADFDGTDAVGNLLVNTLGTFNNLNNQTYIYSLRGGAPTNTPPTLSPVGHKELVVSNALQFEVVALDVMDNDNVTLFATDIPAGATFPSNTLASAITGTFNWASAEPVGVYTTTFWAVDKDGTNIESITITVRPSASIIISEIMQNPTAVDDTAGEWFEVYNKTLTAVDINGWTITNATGVADGHSINNGGPLVVPANGFLVLGALGNITLNGGVQIHYVYTGITLGNAADSLVLLDSNGVQVTVVAWDNGATFPDPAGASMYLKSPALDPNVGANWDTSTNAWPGSFGDYGTPGEPNDTGSWGGSGTDTDGDGIDDGWEQDYFGDLVTASSNSNNDGDAALDWEEYIADTHPTNGESYFNNAITNPLTGTATFTLQAGPPTTNSRIYDAWSTLDLVAEEWVAENLDVPGDVFGAAVFLTVTNDAAGRFYRTGVKLP